MTQATEQQINLVCDRIGKNKAFFQRQSAKCKRAWTLTRTAIMLVNALITLILGLKQMSWLSIDATSIANVALVLSTAVTLLTAADATFDFQWNWVHYGLTLTKIYNIEDELDYLVASGEVTQEQIGGVFDRLQATLGNTNSSWTSRRLRDADGGTTPTNA